MYENPIAKDLGIETKTTFWEDFSIADKFGIAAIEDTYERAFKEWRSDVNYLKELILTLNHKIFQYYESHPHMAELYQQKYYEAYNWAGANLNDEDLRILYAYLD